MANGNDSNNTPPAEPEKPEGGPASLNDITLEQALLAPLDAILKAQLHSARSFLNLLLQLGYPHQEKKNDEDGGNGEGDKDGGNGGNGKDGKKDHDGKPYQLTFKQDLEIDGEIHEQTITVPALSLVPIAPLAVSSAEFQLEMAVREITRHTQMRRKAEGADRDEGRPWYLVDEPINIKGVITPQDQGEEGAAARKDHETSIKIALKMNSIPMPRGLDKLLTSLTELGQVQETKSPDSSGGAPAAEQEGDATPGDDGNNVT